MTSEEGMATRAEPGVLYVVATPIGHLDDITVRAREVLASVDRVLAEDTRHTARLLRHHGIEAPCSALHEHNERKLVDRMVREVEGGARLALVCDAGTPLLSDPGFVLVRALRETGARVVPLPGPSAVTAALSVSGLPVDRFCFEGFLPPRRAARRERIAALAAEPRTLVLLEAPHRLREALSDLGEILGAHRRAVIARELTKIHEQVVLDELGALERRVGEGGDIPARGELVLVIAGAAGAETDREGGPEAVRVLEILLEELAPGRAASLAARITGAPRRALYRRALDAAGDGDA